MCIRDRSVGGATTDLSVTSGGDVGIGIAETTPTARLQVKGSGSTSATTALLVQNSSGTTILSVKDGGADKQVTMNSAQIGSLEFVGRGIATGGGNTITMTFNPLLIGGATIDNSAILQADSTTRGFLPPRMTTTQKNAISSPAAGLQVYDSTTNRAAVYTSAWENVITETNGSPNSVYKLWSGSAAQYAALTPDSSTLYFVI